MALVVDASVAIKWLLAEPQQAEARRLLEGGDPLCAPDLLRIEAASALPCRVRRQEMSTIEAAHAFSWLDIAPLRLDASVPLIPDALRLAMALSHSVYDCVYLALAERLDTSVVTADRAFVDTCTRLGFGNRVRALA